jgi:hypothetical protein
MTYIRKESNMDKIKSIFLGKITRKTYKLENRKGYDGTYWGKPYIAESIETVKREKIAECEVDKPPFIEKETVYIPEIGRYTTIEKAARSIDGSITYNVTYTIKELEDEETLKQKEEAEKKLNKELKEYDTFMHEKLEEEKIVSKGTNINIENIEDISEFEFNKIIARLLDIKYPNKKGVNINYNNEEIKIMVEYGCKI